MTELPADPETAAALARLYDVDLLEDPGDVDLYLALAARTGGPILELAAGTGRVTLALARAGFEVTAVDIDPAALARLSRRLDAAADAALGARVTPVTGDLVGLELPGGQRFKLVIVALNSILLLASRRAQRAAFETMARHLALGGLAVVDVWLPAGDELARYDGRQELEYVRLDPESGLLVAKTTSADHDAAGGTVELTSVYEEGAQGQPARRWIKRDLLRLVGPHDLSEMALAAGLAIETLAGDYELDPLAAHDQRVILVAQRQGRVAPTSLL